MVTRFKMLERLAKHVTDELVLTNLKGTAHEWHYLHPKDSNLLYLGLGMPTPAALGLGHPRLIARALRALARPRFRIAPGRECDTPKAAFPTERTTFWSRRFDTTS